MKKYYGLTIILLAAVMLLAACNQASTATLAPPAATPTSSKAGYPAPAPTKAGYPAPAPTTAEYPTQGGAGYPAPGSGVQVNAANGTTQLIALSAVNTIAKVKVNVNGKEMELRKLADLLKAAGIASYKTATVVGSNGPMQLSGDQLAKAYLDVAGDGMIKLVIDGVQPENWITAVTVVSVE